MEADPAGVTIPLLPAGDLLSGFAAKGYLCNLPNIVVSRHSNGAKILLLNLNKLGIARKRCSDVFKIKNVFPRITF